MSAIDTLDIDDVQKLFPASAKENVKLGWPCVRDCMRVGGLASDDLLVFYALATIRAETGNFAPRLERISPASSTSSHRNFGRYDEIYSPDGQLHFTKGGGVAMKSRLGNKPFLGGTPLDPSISGENQWRDLKGLPRREVTDLHEGERFRGRGFVQLSGRANYDKAAKALRLDLINHPELAEEKVVAAKILVWYLLQMKHKLTQYLSISPRNYVDARAVVNGRNSDGTVNGLDDFQDAFEQAEKIYKKKRAAAAKKTATSGTLKQ